MSCKPQPVQVHERILQGYELVVSNDETSRTNMDNRKLVDGECPCRYREENGGDCDR
jgi:hypothetical protein